MKWAHLPNAGGLYDQDPELLDRFAYIFGKIAEHQKEEQKKSERQAQKTRQGHGSGSRRPLRVRNS